MYILILYFYFVFVVLVYIVMIMMMMMMMMIIIIIIVVVVTIIIICLYILDSEWDASIYPSGINKVFLILIVAWTAIKENVGLTFLRFTETISFKCYSCYVSISNKQLLLIYSAHHFFKGNRPIYKGSSFLFFPPPVGQKSSNTALRRLIIHALQRTLG